MRPSWRRNHQAFSLIELLAVVAIIGVIAVIIIPRVSISTSTANTKTHEHHMAHLNHLIEVYYVQQGAWPTSLSDLAPSYLPDGVPTPPIGGAYGLDGTTHRVTHTP